MPSPVDQSSKPSSFCSFHRNEPTRYEPSDGPFSRQSRARLCRQQEYGPIKLAHSAVDSLDTSLPHWCRFYSSFSQKHRLSTSNWPQSRLVHPGRESNKWSTSNLIFSSFLQCRHSLSPHSARYERYDVGRLKRKLQSGKEEEGDLTPLGMEDSELDLSSNVNLPMCTSRADKAAKANKETRLMDTME